MHIIKCLDAKEAARLQPGDKFAFIISKFYIVNAFRSIMELCESLLKINAERLKKVESTQNKVSEMMRLTFDENGDQKINVNLFSICI